MKTRAAVCLAEGSPWSTEEIDIDEPHAHEVQVQVAYAGLCHSDEHLRLGDMSASPAVLSMLGLPSMFPVIGGHEGSGTVTAVGTEVQTVAVGDRVATAFIPACGTCFWCASGRQHLCDLGMYTLAGPMISDGTWRHHLGEQKLGRMTQLGTFADVMVVHEASLVKLPPDAPLKAAALISCGISTGFGSVVDRAKARPGEVVVVVGCGGVGSGALQGARLAGARAIVAVDPLEFKVDQAKKIGATHGASSMAEAQPLVAEITQGRMADVVVLTPGTLTGDLIAPAQGLGSKDARIVCTAIAPIGQVDVQLNLFNLAMFNQSLLGTVFGSVSPRVQIPRLLALYQSGQLDIDELITKEYSLEAVQQGYDDLHAGRNVRGVVRLSGES
jgi:S-(hydroxymethyl)glutathione dehydrogenase/alcohol dehydrogenase